ncbi:MAG: hypothetical protein SGI96_01955 [Bacteroidota bacterium]|nr:hypothetical protein [Bacteroidota bacterium]
MRKQITTLLLFIAVILWGTWFGGQLFNEALVIPKWLSSPPQSMLAYDAIPVKGGFFFFMINPFFTLFSLLATIFGWNVAGKSRTWMLLATLIGFIVSLVLIFYLAPLIHVTNEYAIQGSIPANQIIANTKEWMVGNRIRLVLEFCGFLFSIIALQTWAKESNYKIAAVNANLK